MTFEEMVADIAFLLARSGCAGSCSFANDRWTGISSNAIVALAYGGAQRALPSDRSDYAACVRTVRRLPAHRKTPEVLAALRRAKEAYLERYPTHRSSSVRREEYERFKREAVDKDKRRRRRRA